MIYFIMLYLQHKFKWILFVICEKKWMILINILRYYKFILNCSLRTRSVAMWQRIVWQTATYKSAFIRSISNLSSQKTESLWILSDDKHVHISFLHLSKTSSKNHKLIKYYNIYIYIYGVSLAEIFLFVMCVYFPWTPKSVYEKFISSKYKTFNIFPISL